MKRTTMIGLIMNLLTCIIISTGCQKKAGVDAKTAQEKISEDINLILQTEMAEMGLSGVKLKTAPKDSDVTWNGTATFESGSGKFDEELTAYFDEYTNSIVWWYSDQPENTSTIFLGESPQAGAEYTSTTGNNTETITVQSTTIALGKVQQKGTTFTTFDTNGREITHFSSPNQQLIGWGKDFFLIQSGSNFTTYDERCREISHISIGGATSASVQSDGFTVKAGTATQRFDRRCRRR